ncbi:MAG: Mur ligase family protein [Bacteroidetes bacterium]|nr:Mur ligase family protein [Bacteroidota bacterium]
MNKQDPRIHFIAIGGSIMHNLAIALHHQGCKITGSDDEIFEPSKSKLSEVGLLPERNGWDTDKITPELEYVIVGMHAQPDNPELQKAHELDLKVYSFPEYIYQHSKDKQRIVIAGSHGKTTITAIILHVLKHFNRKFDYVVGAQIQNFDTMVKLSDAPTIIIEGDEYFTSPEDQIPKFLKYHHHIGLVSGIAWDHYNVFPTIDSYVGQFDKFADATPKGGSIIFNEGDDLATMICGKERPDVNRIEYKTHPHEIVDGKTYLLSEDGKIPVQLFGKHNIQNIAGAKAVLERLSVISKDFYQAIQTFTGASNRMELLKKNGSTYIYKDYAHAPSKLAATTKALKEQYHGTQLVACLELHTFSSLNKDFIKQYKGSFDAADTAIIYYNPETLSLKNLEPIKKKEFKKAFKRKDLHVFTDSQKMEEFLLTQDWYQKNLLLMSSGNFNGLNLNSLSEKIIG